MIKKNYLEVIFIRGKAMKIIFRSSDPTAVYKSFKTLLKKFSNYRTFQLFG